MSDGAVLEGLASAPELSVWVKGACWTGLVASVRGGGGAVCVLLAEGDAPLSPELTVGNARDSVDRYDPLIVTYSRRRGIKVPPAVTRSPLR